MDLRLGRWQDVLADVGEVDAVICDPPYSEVTHRGHDAINRGPRPDEVSRVWRDGGERQAIAYAHWTDDDVRSFCQSWGARCRGWMVAFCDDVLAPVWRREMAMGPEPTAPLHASRKGRYVFAPLPFVSPGSRVRASGDGPSSITTWIVVSRPRTAEFARWGTLPGDYRFPPERPQHIGGKPLSLMRALIRDYTKPGDLVCDPCAGAGTTLLAAAIEGRRAVGAEMDEATHEKAKRRLANGYTPSLFPGAA